MPPSLRHLKQAQTRAALLETGEREARRVGLGKLSIRHVCQVSGYTLGAFYSNFPSRDAFLLELLDGLVSELLKSLSDLVEQTVHQGINDTRQEIDHWLDTARSDSLRADLLLEFMVHARHDEKFRQAFVPRIDAWQSRIAIALETLFTGLGLKPKTDFKTMAMGCSALLHGLTLEGPLHGQDSSTIFSRIILDEFLRQVAEAEPLSGRQSGEQD